MIDELYVNESINCIKLSMIRLKRIVEHGFIVLQNIHNIWLKYHANLEPQIKFQSRQCSIHYWNMTSLNKNNWHNTKYEFNKLFRDQWPWERCAFAGMVWFRRESLYVIKIDSPFFLTETFESHALNHPQDKDASSAYFWLNSKANFAIQINRISWPGNIDFIVFISNFAHHTGFCFHWHNITEHHWTVLS